MVKQKNWLNETSGKMKNQLNRKMNKKEKSVNWKYWLYG